MVRLRSPLAVHANGRHPVQIALRELVKGQLELAHAHGDLQLRELSLALFRHFESRRSGLPAR